MRLRIADCGLRIARRQAGWWIVCAAVLPAAVFAQPAPAATQPAAIPPITFARGGQKIDPHILYVSGEWGIGGIGVFKNEVTLTAFGRVWAGPADVIQQSAGAKTTMTMPKVRVATVFSIVDRGKRVVGEVVVYPDRGVTWDANTTLYTCGELPWFSEWARAVGLPVKQIAPADLLPGEKSNVKALLILGPEQAGNDLSHVAGIARIQRASVLVLYARWFGDAAGPVSVAPAQMLGGLAEIAKQHWPQPLKFTSHRRPWPGIANRWAWIADGNGLPLVEEVAWYGGLWGASRLTVSYVPWQGQLGRREHADELLVSLLTSAATLEMRKQRDPIEVWMVYPPDKQIEPKGRPVLSALRFDRYSIIEPKSVSILDLRGTEKLPAELLGECRKIEGLIGSREGRKESGLLILGDNKMLDEWEWLKLDRAKKTINRPGVVWLPDDELPPSKDNQIRLMLKLTELGVPLVPPKQEEKPK
jgi:hypothetical protein